MLDVIIETDIGRDPDDFFAICYLAACKDVNIKAICISPGDSDQIAFVKLILSILKIDCPVGADREGRNSKSIGGIHTRLLQRYAEKKHPFAVFSAKHDGMSIDILRDISRKNADCQILSIGPMDGIYRHAQKNGFFFPKIVMQGGYVSYDLCPPNILKKDEKFINCYAAPSFNFSGNITAVEKILSLPNLERRFITKSLTHTVYMDEKIYEILKCTHNSRLSSIGVSEAICLFVEGCELYFKSDKKRTKKLFHDVLAASALVHPEFFTWIRGDMIKVEKNKWMTIPNDDGDYIAVDVNRDKFWSSVIHDND